MRAYDVAGDRAVALKVVLEGGDEARIARFRREGELTAALDHPGILKVHYSGTLAGRPFLAYELVEDCRTLDEVLPSLAITDRVALVREAALALGHAHERGILHRDVKPENLLVDASQRVRVADFGLATAADLERLTKTGAVLGTPHYMAPEQIYARPNAMGPTADVWSLGVILYEALTEELPFAGASLMELFAQIASGKPLPPREHEPELSPELEAVCLCALEREPEHRYPNAGAFAEDLERALKGQPVEARTRGGPPRPLIALVAVASLVAVTVAALLIQRHGSAVPPAGEAETAPLTSHAPDPEPAALDPAAVLAGDRDLARLWRITDRRLRLARAERWLSTYAQHPRASQAEALRAGARMRLLEVLTRKRVRFSGDRLLSWDMRKVRFSTWTPDREIVHHGWGPFLGAAKIQTTLAVPGSDRVLVRLRRSKSPVLCEPGLTEPRPLDERLNALNMSHTKIHAWKRGFLLAATKSEGLVVIECGPDLSVQKVRSLFTKADGVRAGVLSVSPTRGLLIAGGLDHGPRRDVDGGRINVYDIDTFDLQLTKEVPNAPDSLAFDDARGVALFSAWGGRMYTHALNAWDAPLRELLNREHEDENGLDRESRGTDDVLGRKRAAFERAVDEVIVSSDGARLYAIGVGGFRAESTNELQVWDVATRRLLRRVVLPSRAKSLSLSHDGALLLISLSTGVQVWATH
jgi:hypothetical protein